MIEHALQVLEFDRIVLLLAGRTVSPPGRELALALRPLRDAAEVRLRLRQTEELQQLASAGGGLPSVGGCRDLARPLQRLQTDGTYLEPEQLLEVLGCCESARDCRKFFDKIEQAPAAAEMASGLEPLPQLIGVLRESIGPRGEILDSASAALAEIRVDIRRTRSRIRQALEKMLANDNLAGAFQDLLITERNGRYVLPVRADRKTEVRGFVHDESASGQTLYVEPEATLDRNNKLRGLLREEQREVERVLRRLAQLVRGAAEDLAQNQRILARFDLLNAAVRLAQIVGGRVPQLIEAPELDLRGARHPLLFFDSEGEVRDGEVVPVDLRLRAADRTLVISGPNTGGKSVALKTAGLLHLMVAAGLPIPCGEGSRLHLFGTVLADIGDEQSIAASQSTFSGHLLNIRAILEQADSESLVLLDELGTGTDPAEGGALGIAVLDALVEAGARTVVTTHLNRIKGYAQLRPGVVNAAVDFDPETLQPTYRLQYGNPGASGALTIARKLGLSATVLDKAEQLLDPDELQGGRLLEELTELQRQTREELTSARQDRETAATERQRRRELLHQFEQQRDKLLERAQQRAEKLVRETEAKLRTLLDEAEKRGSSVAERAEVTRELRSVGEQLQQQRSVPPRSRTDGEVSQHEIVQHRPLGVDGVVVKISGQECELEVAGKRLRCRKSDLLPYRPRKFRNVEKQTRVTSKVEKAEFQPKLLLVGQRVDEALGNLDRFLDAALMHHMKQVEVVHGSGEGILRRAVRDALSSHRGVTGFHAADISFGGENVTIVELAG